MNMKKKRKRPVSVPSLREQAQAHIDRLESHRLFDGYSNDNTVDILKQLVAALFTFHCSHSARIEVGATMEGAGNVLVYWCPDCGALKRTMTNWRYTDWPWRKPRNANDKAQILSGAK